jgi:hypothetical protein
MYDQSARFATTAEPGFVLARLRPLLGLSLTWRCWLPTKAVPLPGGPDRDADLVAVADEDKGKLAWLLIFEFQSEHDPAKPKVLQLEALVFLVYARDTDRGGARFQPVPVFVYLQGECPERTVSVLTPSACGFTGTPGIWEIDKDDAAETLPRSSRASSRGGPCSGLP